MYILEAVYDVCRFLRRAFEYMSCIKNIAQCFFAYFHIERFHNVFFSTRMEKGACGGTKFN